MREDFKRFGEKKIREIKLWAWAAAVLPITGLAGIFFVWAFGTVEMLDQSIAIGGTLMFAIAVFWWWWALHAIYSLLNMWQRTETTVAEVKEGIKEVKRDIRDFFFNSDK